MARPMLQQFTTWLRKKGVCARHAICADCVLVKRCVFLVGDGIYIDDDDHDTKESSLGRDKRVNAKSDGMEERQIEQAAAIVGRW